MIKRKKHILYEGKCWQKVISAVLTTLIFINSVPSMMQINADDGIPDGCYLGTITNEATNANTYETEDSGGDVEEVGKYSAKFYSEIAGNYENGYSTADTALEISTPGQLAAFAKFVNDGKNFSGKYVKLTDNIDLEGTAPTITVGNADTNDRCNVTISGNLSNVWVPIGTSSAKSFAGTFDGGGYEIRDMVVNQNPSSGDAYAGLFGYVRGGTIQNVSVTGEKSTIIASSSSSSSSVYSGGIVGYAIFSSTISNCSNTGKVFSSSSKSSYSGGIVGEAKSSSISNCSNTGNVYSSSTTTTSVYSGGIVGEAKSSSSISNCSNTGNISSFSSASSYYSSYSGGIVGRATSSSISNCSNTGNVSSSSSSSSRAYSGGIVGDAPSDTISSCSNTGNVSSSSSSSSLVYSGGIVGCAYNSSTVSNCSNTGDVSSSSSYAYSGGIVGYAETSSISNCSNTGAVSAVSSSSSSRAYSGGIVGSVESATIECCYSAANKITATGSSWYIGGVIGFNDGATSNNCYYDKNLAGGIGAIGAASGTGSDDTANKVKGLTTAEMQGENAKTYMEGFEAQMTADEKKVWYFSANKYPQFYTDTILSVNPPPNTTTGI